jgi:hypothetical protein
MRRTAPYRLVLCVVSTGGHGTYHNVIIPDGYADSDAYVEQDGPEERRLADAGTREVDQSHEERDKHSAEDGVDHEETQERPHHLGDMGNEGLDDSQGVRWSRHREVEESGSAEKTW